MSSWWLVVSFENCSASEEVSVRCLRWDMVVCCGSGEDGGGAGDMTKAGLEYGERIIYAGSG